MTYETPTAPDTLGEHGARFWQRVADAFVLEPWHLDVLEQASLALDRAESCRRQIEADGLLTEDRFEQAKAHPLIASERDARSAFRMLYRELNLDEDEKKPPGRPPRDWSIP